MDNANIRAKIAQKDAEIWTLFQKWADFKRVQEIVHKFIEAGSPEELEEEAERASELYDKLGVEFGFWTWEDLRS